MSSSGIGRRLSSTPWTSFRAAIGLRLLAGSTAVNVLPAVVPVSTMPPASMTAFWTGSWAREAAAAAPRSSRIASLRRAAWRRAMTATCLGDAIKSMLCCSAVIDPLSAARRARVSCTTRRPPLTTTTTRTLPRHRFKVRGGVGAGTKCCGSRDDSGVGCKRAADAAGGLAAATQVLRTAVTITSGCLPRISLHVGKALTKVEQPQASRTPVGDRLNEGASDVA
jgi:hypothetical protein